MSNEVNDRRIVLGLDVSTSCIGVSVVLDDNDDKPTLLKLTHVSPKVDKKDSGLKSLFLKKRIFEEFLNTLKDLGITEVVIEEPLFSSNNKYTVATLIRFNGMISDAVFNVLGIVPRFISSYDARSYSFPDLMSIRKLNKSGKEYSPDHIEHALKTDKLVLFGDFPFDVDKKQVMMDKIHEKYPEIEWVRNKSGKIIKENYDAVDAMVCALAYISLLHNGPDAQRVESFTREDGVDKITYRYTTSVWGKTTKKILILNRK